MPVEFAPLGRRSIAVYFYTRERPAAETVPSHGTIYIPQPLPERFQPGYTINEHDAGELLTLLERRDTQIEYLHGRELELSRALESPSFRLGRALTWPLRKLLRRK